MAKKQELALGIVRMVVGLIFLAHGYQKLFIYGPHGIAGSFAQLGLPFPIVSAYLATFAEFFGGLALLIGLGTRLAAIPVGFTMVVALVKVHLAGGFFLPKGFEYVLMLLAANIALVLGGGGAFALDNLIRSRKPKLVVQKLAA